MNTPKIPQQEFLDELAELIADQVLDVEERRQRIIARRQLASTKTKRVRTPLKKKGDRTPGSHDAAGS